MHKADLNERKKNLQRQSCGKINANTLKYKMCKSHWAVCTLKLCQRNTVTFSPHVTPLLTLCPVISTFSGFDK